ncbi:hypothetical protein HS088_TW14G00041 [Tripterygium wilfordii]|uniref:Uncharacterized protein n=1 Tax=Tripterygium wilfordii TaxID=458696 RepID=A0A7J7CPB7_TRIWF|nr:hypothetical protein HS088_TW14G00041 [Tripterygium wilfordii]
MLQDEREFFHYFTLWLNHCNQLPYVEKFWLLIVLYASSGSVYYSITNFGFHRLKLIIIVYYWQLVTSSFGLYWNLSLTRDGKHQIARTGGASNCYIHQFLQLTWFG